MRWSTGSAEMRITAGEVTLFERHLLQYGFLGLTDIGRVILRRCLVRRLAE